MKKEKNLNMQRIQNILKQALISLKDSNWTLEDMDTVEKNIETLKKYALNDPKNILTPVRLVRLLISLGFAKGKGICPTCGRKLS